MEKVLQLLRKTLKGEPKDWDIRKHLMDCYLAGYDIAAAVDLVRAAPNVPDKDEDLVVVVNFLASHDPFAAMGFAERAVETDGTRGAAHLAKAIACDHFGKPGEAAAHKTIALQLDPDLASLLDLEHEESEQAAEVAPAPEADPQPNYDEQLGVGGLASATGLLTIQPLVSPEELPEPMDMVFEESAMPPLAHTTSEELEATRSHLLVADPHGAFLDADDLGEAEELEVGALVVAPAGVAPKPAELDESKAKLSAIAMTIGVHLIVFIIIGFIIIAAPRLLPPEIVATMPSEESDMPSPKQVVDQAPPKQVQPQAAASAMLTSLSANPVTVPNVDLSIDTTTDFGTNFGANMSFGSRGNGFGSVPFTMKSRCSSSERQKLLRENGGSPEVGKAIRLSLDYLKSTQNRDGSWGEHYKASMTAFALLSFLGHCETPDSAYYGNSVLQGIMFLVELSQKNNGILSARKDRHYPYEHGIATYALGETYALAKYGRRRLPGVREAFEEGTKLIIRNQLPDGGWRYAYAKTGNGDTSITGWQYQALKAAKHTRLKIEGLDTSIGQVERFFGTVRKGGDHYTYNRAASNGAGSDWALTGACVLGMQLLGKGDEHKTHIDAGMKYLVANAGKHGTYRGGSELYGWYYMTQAAFQHGGDGWKKWNGIFRDALLKEQHKSGQWKRDATVHGGLGVIDRGVYRQCLNTLMLEVYFRYLPAAG